jgi:hypothetical protein
VLILAKAPSRGPCENVSALRMMMVMTMTDYGRTQQRLKMKIQKYGRLEALE